MIRKQPWFVICILVITLILSGCKAKKDTSATTETMKPTATQAQTSFQTDPTEAEAKYTPQEMELPDEEETLSDNTSSSSIATLDETKSTQASDSSVAQESTKPSVTPKPTEDLGPYGNGPNSTRDDEL